MQHFVYLIGKEEDLNNIDKCYVGVTNSLEKRWAKHTYSKSTIGEYIRANMLTYEANMIVHFSGTKEECYSKEKELRPFPNMGLNEAIGGLGGYTKYTQERNQKISIAMKNRVVTWGDKVSKTKKEKGTAVGSDNPKAKAWIIISPAGKLTHLHGTLELFCKENNILVSVLRRYINEKVPPLLYSGRGGFRPKNNTSLIMRQNTTGWTLKENKNYYY